MIASVGFSSSFIGSWDSFGITLRDTDLGAREIVHQQCIYDGL